MNLVANLGQAVSILRTYPVTMLALGLCAVIPQIPITLAQLWLVRAVWPLDLPVTFVSWVVGEIVVAATIFASAKAASGDKPDFFESLRAAVRRFAAIFEFVVRYLGSFTLLTVTIVGIPFAIRILVRWSFGTQSIMLKEVNAKEAISLSCQITSERWWQLAGVMLLFLVFALPFLAGAFLLPLGITTAAWAVVSVVTTPLLGCFWTLLFLDLEQHLPASQPQPVPVS